MQAGPSEPLRCVSVHSVKGGVGKSTLSYLLARSFAERGERTLLVDVDLTGTSLADVLPLRAPELDRDDDERLVLSGGASGQFLTPAESRQRVRARASSDRPSLQGVPFLNDLLLATGGRADIQEEVNPDRLVWSLPEGDPLCGRLGVIPSSALPVDLGQILPILYDELHAAWIEGRLEWLLHLVLKHTTYRRVVFDSPPAIPGLSRALLSMAIRLPRQIDLARDGGTPLLLKSHPVAWSALLVVSPDHQDLRAADRWLFNRERDELEPLWTVINGVPEDELGRSGERREAVLRDLRTALASGEEPAEMGGGHSSVPSAPGDLLDADVEPIAYFDTDYSDPLLAPERDVRIALLPRRGDFGLFRPRSGRGGVRVPPEVEALCARIDAAVAL